MPEGSSQATNATSEETPIAGTARETNLPSNARNRPAQAQGQSRAHAGTGARPGQENTGARNRRDTRDAGVSFATSVQDDGLRDRFASRYRRPREGDQDHRDTYSTGAYGVAANPLVPWAGNLLGGYSSAPQMPPRQEPVYNPYTGPSFPGVWSAGYAQPSVPYSIAYPEHYVPPINAPFFTAGAYPGTGGAGPAPRPAPAPTAAEAPAPQAPAASTQRRPQRPRRNVNRARDESEADDEVEAPRATREEPRASGNPNRLDEIFEAERRTRLRMQEEAIRWQEFRDADVRREREALKRARIMLQHEQEMVEKQKQSERLARQALRDEIMAEVQAQTQAMMQEKEEELREAKEAIRNLEAASRGSQTPTVPILPDVVGPSPAVVPSPPHTAASPVSTAKTESTAESIWRARVRARRAARKKQDDQLAEELSDGKDSSDSTEREERERGEDLRQATISDDDDVSNLSLNHPPRKRPQHSPYPSRTVSSSLSSEMSSLGGRRRRESRGPTLQEIAADLVDHIMQGFLEGIDDRFEYYVGVRHRSAILESDGDSDDSSDDVGDAGEPAAPIGLDVHQYRVRDEESVSSSSDNEDEDQFREALEAPPTAADELFGIRLGKSQKAALPVSRLQPKEKAKEVVELAAAEEELFHDAASDSMAGIETQAPSGVTNTASQPRQETLQASSADGSKQNVSQEVKETHEDRRKTSHRGKAASVAMSWTGVADDKEEETLPQDTPAPNAEDAMARSESPKPTLTQGQQSSWPWSRLWSW